MHSSIAPVSFFLRRAEFVECKQIGSETINGGEIWPSWVSLEPQFEACNDIFSVDKIMKKMPCKHSQRIHSKLFTFHKLSPS